MLWNGPAAGSGVDCTPALVAMCNSPQNDGEIKFPWGQFSFKTQPPNDIIAGMRIIGNTRESTTLLIQFDGYGQPFLVLTGAKNNGTIIEQINIAQDGNYPARTGIYMQGNAVSQPDATVLRQISMTGNYLDCIYINGSLRSSPQGCRGVLIEDCDLFGASMRHISATNVVALTIRGGGCYVPTGSPGGVLIDGGSNQVTIEGHWNNCLLEVDNSIQVCVLGGIQSGGRSVNNANASFFP